MAFSPPQRPPPASKVSGRRTVVRSNTFPITLPQYPFKHFDVLFHPPPPRPQDGIESEPRAMPRSRKLEIIDRLQTHTNPGMFTPRGTFDGQKNMYIKTKPNIDESGTYTIKFSEKSAGYKVTLKFVDEIHPSALRRAIQSQKIQNMDGNALQVIQAMDVMVRMAPMQKSRGNVSNSRSFFINPGPNGGYSIRGIQLWAGYFQSVRPVQIGTILNIDITTGLMYSPGPLVKLCMEHLDFRDVRDLVHLGAPANRTKANDLRKFLTGVRVVATYRKDIRPEDYQRRATPIKGIEQLGARRYQFDKDGSKITVEEYLYNTHQIRLKYPDVFCVDLGRGSVIPIECLTVIPGQLYRKTPSPEIRSLVVRKTEKKPEQRFDEINKAFRIMEYENSDYMNQSGVKVTPNAISASGRVIDAPMLAFGGGKIVAPRGGQWNMVDQKVANGAVIRIWAIVIFDPNLDDRNGRDIHTVQKFAEELTRVLVQLGMTVEHPPYIKFASPQLDVSAVLNTVGIEAMKLYPSSSPPSLIVAVVAKSTYVRDAIKRWGDIERGCPTQICLSEKIKNVNNQYLNNVGLKINVKRGGINAIPVKNGPGMAWITKARSIIIGADVSHPGPGSDMPSVSGIVASMDEPCVTYTATSRVQPSRREDIVDLQEMLVDQLSIFRERARGRLPQQMLFMRDGVSEGQFAFIAATELVAIRKALIQVGAPDCSITFVIVGKRHHIRFIPMTASEADRSGNCPPGLVVDQELTHPILWDFYLQSHAGLKGTSRSSHYSVLHDEHKFTQESLEALCYTLCHVYARSTRTVSIPAPVYYADLVCSRARYHYREGIESSDGSQDGSAAFTFEQYRESYQPIHPAMKRRMYFM